MLKAIAEQRGWEYHHHRAANRLRSETRDSGIRRFFNSASALHENDMDADVVGDSLDDGEALLAKLTPLLTPM